LDLGSTGFDLGFTALLGTVAQARSIAPRVDERRIQASVDGVAAKNITSLRACAAHRE